MHPNHLSALVRKYLEQAGIAKPGACHLFRHYAECRIMPTQS